MITSNFNACQLRVIEILQKVTYRKWEVSYEEKDKIVLTSPTQDKCKFSAKLLDFDWLNNNNFHGYTVTTTPEFPRFERVGTMWEGMLAIDALNRINGFLDEPESYYLKFKLFSQEESKDLSSDLYISK